MSDFICDMITSPVCVNIVCARDYSPAGALLRRVCPEEFLVGSSQRNSGMHPTFTKHK